MPTVHIMGKVLPDGFKLNIKLPAQVFQEVETGNKITYLVNIVESHVGVEITLDSFEPSDTSDLANHAFELARAAIDLFGFHVGYGLTVVLSRFIDPDGKETILVPRTAWTTYVHPSFNEQTIHEVPEGVINWSYDLLAANPTLAIAVHSLIVAISQPRYAELNCARAMECLRVFISPNCSNEGAAWMNMQLTLNVSENYIRSITEVSKGPRHGNIKFFPFEKITEITHKAWLIMERFIEMQRRQLSRLPIDEFPLL